MRFSPQVQVQVHSCLISCTRCVWWNAREEKRVVMSSGVLLLDPVRCKYFLWLVNEFGGRGFACTNLYFCCDSCYLTCFRGQIAFRPASLTKVYWYECYVKFLRSLLRCLFFAIQRLLKLTHLVLLTFYYKSNRMSHIDFLFQLSIKESVLTSILWMRRPCEATNESRTQIVVSPAIGE
jgi:hypothetical protein